MPKYKAEVEFDDDGPAMAGSGNRTIRRAEIFELEVKNKGAFKEELHKYFRENLYYATIRRIGNVDDA